LPDLAYLARTRIDRQVPGLVLEVQSRAHPAVVAGGPAAVLELGLTVHRVAVVLPQPVLLQTGVEVVPGEHLVLVALPRVPGDVHARLGAGTPPGLDVEALVPPVEAGPQLEGALDGRRHAAVAAGQQALDDAGQRVVVAQVDRPVAGDAGPDQTQLARQLLGGVLGAPLERGV